MNKSTYLFIRRILKIAKEILVICGMILVIILQMKQVL